MSQSIIEKAIHDRPVVIAGPCSAETREQVVATARALADQNIDCYRAGLWKPRTRPGEFEGVGARGLDWLMEVRDRFGLRVCTEVATPQHVQECMRNNIDAVWIGARTTTSPFVVQELAEALRGLDIPVLVKNPVVADFKLWLGAIERLSRCGVKNIGAIHRGFKAYEETDYRNRPRWQIVIDLMSEHPELPIWCDPSHIAGSREHIPVVSQKAMDLSFHGLMVETHIDPDKALTDAAQQLTPDGLRALLSNLVIRSGNGTIEHAPLQKLRQEINDLDDELIKVLARRMRVSQKIGDFKKNNNMTIYQAKRWDDLLASHIEFGERLGLTQDFTVRIFKAVHQESIDVQEKVLSADD